MNNNSYLNVSLKSLVVAGQKYTNYANDTQLSPIGIL